MKLKAGLVAGVLICCIMGIAGMANATLTTIGTATYNSSGYNIIYDDDLQLTWLDYTNSPMHWQDQVNWATGLNTGGVLSYNLNADVIVSSWNETGPWRLPVTVDGVYQFGWDGTTSAGYNITSSEMGHLFYAELGNQGYQNIDGSYNTIPPAPDYFLQNIGDFSNLISTTYWSGTEYTDLSDVAWVFSFADGYQYDDRKGVNFCGLAVRPGQITFDTGGGGAPVPEPATMLLFGTGLAGLGLAGTRIRRKKK